MLSPEETKREVVRTLCERFLLEPGHQCICMRHSDPFRKVPTSVRCRDTAEQMFSTTLAVLEICGHAINLSSS